jgi:nitroreductase
MGQRLRGDRTADGDDPQVIEDDVVRSYARITEAPVVIVVCLDIRDMDRYPDDQRNTAEYLMAVQSTAMAVQNLLLAAHGEGLGACVMCAPLFCQDSVSDGLGLPSEWKAQMLVTIGTPPMLAEIARACPWRRSSVGCDAQTTRTQPAR